MGAYKGGDARYNIVSFRVTDEEFTLLQAMAGGKPISQVMRSLVGEYVAHISEVSNDAA